MPRVRSTKKLDTALDELTATDRQAVASARWWIELRGGLSHKHSRDYWRFSTKAELRGQVEASERFVQGIKDYLVKSTERYPSTFFRVRGNGTRSWRQGSSSMPSKAMQMPTKCCVKRRPNVWKEASCRPSHCRFMPPHLYGLVPVGKRQGGNRTQANRNHIKRIIVIGFLR